MIALPRRCLAEALGTFVFVFIGCAVILTDSYPNAGYHLLGIALAQAVCYGVMISCTLSISGGHLNPAVTLSLLSVRRIDAKTAAAYVGSQLVGAVLGALAVRMMLPGNIVQVGILGTPTIVGTFSLTQAMALEALLTFVLVSAVFGTTISANAPKLGGFGIGLVLFFDILVGGPLTGAAMNPARAFGPALISGTWYAQLVWWVGPIAGGIIAAQLWHRVLLEREQ